MSAPQFSRADPSWRWAPACEGHACWTTPVRPYLSWQASCTVE